MEVDGDCPDSSLWDADWDNAPPGTVGEAARALRNAAVDRDVGRRHVLFVRHAQAAGGGGLSAAGRKQAEATGRRLRELVEANGASVAAVYHSGAPEAAATAEILRACLPGSPRLAASELLAEGVPFVPSPAPLALAALGEEELRPAALRAEDAFRAHVWRPSGERREQVSVEVVVGHGNSLRYILCRALQLHPAAWSRLAAYHCGVTWLDIDCEGTVVLREFGGVGHLPKGLVTYS